MSGAEVRKLMELEEMLEDIKIWARNCAGSNDWEMVRALTALQCEMSQVIGHLRERLMGPKGELG